MNWYKQSKKENSFSYEDEHRALWRILISKEMERCGIRFDLENDYEVKSRMMDCDLKRNEDDEYKYKVYAEMYEAGGDWECPNIYFRCQMYKKYKNSRWSSGEKFVYIPKKNLNLKDGQAIHNDESVSECNRLQDFKEKDLWDMLQKESILRKKQEWKMNETSDNYDTDSWSAGYVGNLLKHWKSED